MFNSIQVVCRERAIIKREHRAGMHITSYVGAHMVYQGVICLLQSGVMMAVLKVSGVTIPKISFVTGSSAIDLTITFFFITYAADMLALFVSSLVKNPTTAMTIVPFLLIFQLVFAGTFFNLKGAAAEASNFTLSKWGINSICAEGGYNDLPMTSIWSSLVKMRNVEYEGEKPVKRFIDDIKSSGKKELFEKKCGEQNYDKKYESSKDNVIGCWITLVIYALLFAAAAVTALKFIDKDKR